MATAARRCEAVGGGVKWGEEVEWSRGWDQRDKSTHERAAQSSPLPPVLIPSSPPSHLISAGRPAPSELKSSREAGSVAAMSHPLPRLSSARGRPSIKPGFGGCGWGGAARRPPRANQNTLRHFPPMEVCSYFRAFNDGSWSGPL